MTKYYAGIGSRETPLEELGGMRTLASMLEQLGYVLRSGGAKGADKAFESGVQDPRNKQIFRPKHTPLPEALEIASQYHPAWRQCSSFAKSCHARNVQQVLGARLDEPAEFVLCWTPGGAAVGGTATAILVARQEKICVHNFAHKEHLTGLMDVLREMLLDEKKKEKVLQQRIEAMV